MKHSMKLLVVRLVVIAGLLLTSQVMAATVPKTLNYQGTLTDNAGVPINGSKDITVSLYTVANGGTPFWTETQTGVVLKNGQFSMVLGKGTVLDETKQALLSGETYIGITVAPDTTEMVPRQQFTSVAYALKSGDGVPIGAIIMWSGAQIPTGWQLCDGTNGTPNLKDRFIVGAGGKYILEAKDDKSVVNLNHTHTVNSHAHGISAVDINHTHNDDHNHSGSTSNENANRDIDNGNNVSQENMADNHSHSFTTNYKSQQGQGATTGWMNQNNSHNHGGVTDAQTPATNAQLSTAQEILPPYYALAFIMKVQ